ncbi:MAG TPA: DUF2007 domain-containing protein [Geobacterales bacterium]|nr:DUF2007 domain-containing protein [Geobacterales bacterium]
MVRFYDPRDVNELAVVEDILQRGGIEYFLRKEPEGGLSPQQVHVAEEDLPKAERLILKAGLRHCASGR